MCVGDGAGVMCEELKVRIIINMLLAHCVHGQDFYSKEHKQKSLCKMAFDLPSVQEK